MSAAANMVEVAALVGDTARATMLAMLMSGQALTASELACLARVSPATASGHLSKLARARLIAVTKKRRYRYYCLASPLIAQMLESIKLVAALEVPPRYQPRLIHDDALRFARTCYDHVAGRLGVAIADGLAAGGAIVLTADGGEVTRSASDCCERLAPSRRHPEAGAFSAGPVLTGANGATTSQAMWALRFVAAASNSVGSNACAIRAPFV